MLVRFFKRRESYKLGAQDLYDYEFCKKSSGDPETELSVFEVDECDWRRTCLERWAAVSLDPKNWAQGVDVSSIRNDAKPEPEAWAFKQTANAHRVLCFKDGAELFAFVEAVVRGIATKTCKLLLAEKKDLGSELHACIANGDPAWNTFMKTTTNNKWSGFPRPPSQPPPAAAP